MLLLKGCSMHRPASRPSGVLAFQTSPELPIFLWTRKGAQGFQARAFWSLFSDLSSLQGHTSPLGLDPERFRPAPGPSEEGLGSLEQAAMEGFPQAPAWAACVMGRDTTWQACHPGCTRMHAA